MKGLSWKPGWRSGPENGGKGAQVRSPGDSRTRDRKMERMSCECAGRDRSELGQYRQEGDALDGARRARTVDPRSLGHLAVVSQVRCASVN